MPPHQLFDGAHKISMVGSSLNLFCPTIDLYKAIVSIGDYSVGKDAAEKNKKRLRLTALLAERVERIRMFGTAALDLAWVAEGRTDSAVILPNSRGIPPQVHSSPEKQGF